MRLLHRSNTPIPHRGRFGVNLPAGKQRGMQVGLRTQGHHVVPCRVRGLGPVPVHRSGFEGLQARVGVTSYENPTRGG